MKKRIVFILILLTITVSDAVAQGGSGVHHALSERRSVYGAGFAKDREEPSLRHMQYETSFTQLSLSYEDHRKDGYGLFQEGLGHRRGSLSTQTYLRDTYGMTLWGKAGYSRGVEKSIKWGSSLDLDRLYPYYVADSVGGDMTMECYSFSGGLNAPLPIGNIAAEASYMASHGVRTVDPRPRGIVSDFEVKAGYSLKVSPQYILGCDFSFDTYKQAMNVVHYNETSQAAQWLMTGVGNTFNRTSLGKGTMYYIGHKVGGGVSLVPYGQAGLYAAFGYGYSFLERVFAELNAAPVNNYREQTVQGRLGYLHSGGRHDYGIRSDVMYRLRIGSDKILGDAASGEYEVITTLPLFVGEVTSVGAAAFMGSKSVALFSWLISSSVRYDRTVLRSIYPERAMIYNYLSPALDIKLSRVRGAHELTLTASGMCRRVLSSKQTMLRALLSPTMLAYLDHNHAYLSGDVWGLAIEPGYGYNVAHRYMVGLSCRYGYTYTAHAVERGHKQLTITITLNY